MRQKNKVIPSLTFPPDFPLFRPVRPLGAFYCLQSELGRL